MFAESVAKWYDGLGNGTKLIIGTIGTAAGVFGFTAEGMALSEALLYGASTVAGSSAFSATVNVVESAFKNWFAGESYTTAGEDWTHSFLNSYGIDGFLFGISGLRYSGSGSAASTAKVTESYCATNVERHSVVESFNGLATYDPEFAARQLLNGGYTSEDLLKSIVPKDSLNTFVPSGTITNGYKYNFGVNGKKMEVKWHSADANAAARFPNSNSGAGWSAQIKVGNKLLGQDGNFYRKPQNLTHIPIR